jgi:hypothetical protein
MRLSATENVLLLATAMMLGGVVTGYFKEVLGALLMLIGYTMFAIIEREIWIAIWFVLFLVTAALYLFSWWRRRDVRRENRTLVEHNAR